MELLPVRQLLVLLLLLLLCQGQNRHHESMLVPGKSVAGTVLGSLQLATATCA